MATGVDLPSGSEIAGHRIEQVIGEGGMGVVYRARQLRLDRIVALKVLSPYVAVDPTFRKRFERESRIAASLDHPNVVTVFEAGEDQGRLFIAMRYVDGPDLGQLIERGGGLEPARCARIIAQVAAALDSAHQRGLVHRDIKPGNILISDSGGAEWAYLSDFGLTADVASKSSLTKAGTVLGSLDYMAPEQIRGEQVSAATDIYALGCVLYESLTGRAPFSGNQGMRVLWAHLQEEPQSASELVPGLSPEFDAVIERALAKQPEERFATAAELGRATTTAAGESAAAPVPVEERPGTRVATEMPPRPPVERGGGRPVRPRPRGQAVASLRPSGQAAVRIPLDPRFEYTNAPLDEDCVIPLLGHEQLVERLIRRVAHSKGGSLLLTGFRGVGKTTVVQRALARVASGESGPALVPLTLNVARPATSSELLYELVRALFDELEESGVLDRLDSRTRERIRLAYDRTSRSRTHTSASAVERARGAGVSGMVAPVTPKLDLSRKTLVSEQSEDVFHEYRDADVEHDFARIVERLQGGGRSLEKQPPRSRLLGRRKELEPWTGHVVVIIDELDKLTAHPEGRESIRALLMTLKNLLTIRGAHFIFVAGADLQEEAVREHRRGNSVYDSVFSWQAYVPCVWGAERELLDALIPDAEARARPQVGELRDHLAFWGRGVPRLLLRELDSFVAWEGEQPCLLLDDEAMARIEFYAALHRVVDRFVQGHEGAAAKHLDVDQWRLGVYYAVEWILNFQVSFTVEHVVGLSTDASIDPLLALTEDEVHDLLEHLEEHGLLRQVGGLARQTYYGDVPEAQLLAYELVEDVAGKLQAFGRPMEAAAPPDEVPADAAAAARAFAGVLDRRLGGGRYHILEELDHSGAGRVYRALDTTRESEVAVKVFDLSPAAGHELMRARFQREGRIAVELEHPGIVRTYDTFTEDDGTLGIVMELVQGRSLAQRLDEGGALEPAAAVSVGCSLLEALEYLERKGVARLDLRPSGILVNEEVAPTIVNLGLLKRVGVEEDRATQAGAVVGTPAYAAPEQLAGKPVDIRADIFSLALILFELLTGEPARKGDSIASVLQAALQEEVDVLSVAVSQQLRASLARALERDPGRRFATPSEMLNALRATPEAEGVRRGTEAAGEDPAGRRSRTS